MGGAATEHLSEPPTKSSHVPNVVGLRCRRDRPPGATTIRQPSS